MEIRPTVIDEVPKLARLFADHETFFPSTAPDRTLDHPACLRFALQAYLSDPMKSDEQFLTHPKCQHPIDRADAVSVSEAPLLQCSPVPDVGLTGLVGQSDRFRDCAGVGGVQNQEAHVMVKVLENEISL